MRYLTDSIYDILSRSRLRPYQLIDCDGIPTFWTPAGFWDDPIKAIYRFWITEENPIFWLEDDES